MRGVRVYDPDLDTVQSLIRFAPGTHPAALATSTVPPKKTQAPTPTQTHTTKSAWAENATSAEVHAAGQNPHYSPCQRSSWPQQGSRADIPRRGHFAYASYTSIRSFPLPPRHTQTTPPGGVVERQPSGGCLLAKHRVPIAAPT